MLGMFKSNTILLIASHQIKYDALRKRIIGRTKAITRVPRKMPSVIEWLQYPPTSPVRKDINNIPRQFTARVAPVSTVNLISFNLNSWKYLLSLWAMYA
jgi:hypothetical protein